MPDITDSKTDSIRDNSDKFAHLSAYEVFQSALSDERQKLVTGFVSLTSRLDSNVDDALNKDELRLGVFQQVAASVITPLVSGLAG